MVLIRRIVYCERVISFALLQKNSAISRKFFKRILIRVLIKYQVQTFTIHIYCDTCSLLLVAVMLSFDSGE